MSDCCENMKDCGFFKKYESAEDPVFRMACKGFVISYCKGDKQGECKRKQYMLKTGKTPSPDMMPSGKMVYGG